MTPANRFHRFVVEELVNDRLILPRLPDTARRVHALAAQQDVGAERLAAEIGQDPVLASRLLHVAAGVAARRGSSRVETQPQAVLRLGLENTRLLVAALAMEPLFQARDPMLHDCLRRSWQRSVLVGALAQTIAAHFTLLDPVRALLAGLVHDAGALAIVRLVEARPDLVETESTVEAVIRLLSPRIGRRLLQAWHFPPEIAPVPALCIDLRREHPGPPDYADVVSVACLQVDAAPAVAARGGVPAWAKLGLKSGADPLDIDICRERFERARAAFAA